jgi:L-cysteine:1D-myo-inositol 2-amino-2-deoxy-alpha-D-glucopyranoside ligase
MADDLDAPGALAVIDGWAAAVADGSATGGAMVRAAADALLGILL